MPDEIQILLSNCDGLLRGLLKPLVTVALHTGARKGELRGLKRWDIQMNETAKATLQGLERKAEFVFPSPNGKSIDTSQIQIASREAIRRSGVEGFHFHDLRHTFASNLVMEGAELNDVRELLGHKNMAMILRYAHRSPKHKTKVVHVLNRVMAEKPMSQNPPQGPKVVNLEP